jgi:thiamine transport system ATP-binding protein
MLSLEDLRAAFDHPVLEGVDLTVPTGSIVCILGPSGGGKSTLLRAVAGLVAYSGVIRIDGRDLDGVPAHRRDVGLMFQKDLLFPHLDVAGNVGYGLQRRDPRRVAELLDLVGMPGYGPRSVETLSGGQAQRVALARALARNPRVLLLDEPFGALDVVLKAELVLDVQRLLREQGTTVLAVSHDRQEAFTLADEVAVLRGGRIVQQTSPQELWRAPRDGYVARLVGQTVLDGVAYPPEALEVRADGRWDVRVTGRTFRDGHYLLTGVVGDEQVMLRCDEAMPQVGERVRIGPVRGR